jgi:hypothetical protein
MPRVSSETLRALAELLDSIPPEAKSKCALCNETLTHIVKQAEAQTGAGTATVTRMLADRINESAAPGDRVSENALRHRVQYADSDICPNRANNSEPSLVCSVGSDGTENKKPIVAERTDHEVAMRYAKMAIADLRQIRNYHHDWKEALNFIETWVVKTRKELA